MKSPAELFRSIIKKKNQTATDAAGSKFERLDFGPGRFDCTLSSLSRSSACEDLFLDVYSRDALREILARAGVMDHLRDRGFPSPVLKTGKDDAGIHRLRIFYGKPAPSRLLIEIRLSRLIYLPDARLVGGIIRDRRFNAIAIEWLCFQNPRARFTAERPRLPGQTYPGLGAVRFLAPLMRMFAGELGADAVLDVPERFHAAVMYSRTFRFTDPEREGLLRASLRDLGSYPLADLSRAFDAGAVRDERTGKPVAYVPSEQLLPVSEDLARYFASRKYLKLVEAAADRMKLALDLHRAAGSGKKS